MEKNTKFTFEKIEIWLGIKFWVAEVSPEQTFSNFYNII